MGNKAGLSQAELHDKTNYQLDAIVEARNEIMKRYMLSCGS
jgi:hypothetical protein